MTPDRTARATRHPERGESTSAVPAKYHALRFVSGFFTVAAWLTIGGTLMFLCFSFALGMEHPYGGYFRHDVFTAKENEALQAEWSIALWSMRVIVLVAGITQACLLFCIAEIIRLAIDVEADVRSAVKVLGRVDRHLATPSTQDGSDPST